MKDILEKINVSKKELENSAFKLVVSSDVSNDVARKKFQKLLEKYLNDVNVITLLWASHLLNEKITRDKPELNKEDPAYFVTDEILGMSIANYIGGTNAIFNFRRYDTEKPGILSKLDSMIDDAMGGLIAGIMTKVYE